MTYLDCCDYVQMIKWIQIILCDTDFCLFYLYMYVYLQARLLGSIFPFWENSMVLSIVPVSVFIQNHKDAFVTPASMVPVSITAILTDLVW